MKLFGHPIHAMFLHFPAALLPMDLALSLMGHYFGNPSLVQAGFYCMVGASLTGIAALLTGLLDFTAIKKDDRQAQAMALTHGLVNGSVMLLYLMLTWKVWKSGAYLAAADTKLLWFKGAAVAVLFFGNYLGGKLVYQYHVGIINKE